jgi:hypothetical protein
MKLIKYADYEIELKLTPQLKTRIKILVAKAYKLGKNIATVTDIKKLFSWDLRKTTSWFAVMAECLEKIEREDVPMWKIIENKIKELGLIVGSCDSLLGYRYDVSARLNDKIKFIGTLGYCKLRNLFFYGNRRTNFYFDTLDQASTALYNNSGLNKVAA